MLSKKIGTRIIFAMLTVCLLTEVHAASTNETGVSEDRAFKAEDVGTGRTFGQIKKFQAALLPIMYKLGVMSAVIMMTLFLAFKSVFIGTLILVLNITFFAIKFGSFLKHDHGNYVSHSHGWAAPAHHDNGWAPHKDVHLHIHNAHNKPDLSIPYSTLSGGHGWDTQAHPSVVEPTWNAGSYVHSGRTFSGNDLIQSPSIAAQVATERFKATKSGAIESRSDNKPTIVMAHTKRSAQQAASPYNYLNRQNRK